MGAPFLFFQKVTEGFVLSFFYITFGKIIIFIQLPPYQCRPESRRSTPRYVIFYSQGTDHPNMFAALPPFQPG